MSKPIPFESEGEIIDVSPRRPRRPRRWWWLVLAGAALLFLASRALSIYISALWFGSLGYAPVYWYMFRLKIELFAIFFVLTLLILRGGLWLIERGFARFAFDSRTVFINQQSVNISPGRFLRPIAWIVSVLAGLVFGLSMREAWRSFALYSHQASTELTDPIFHKPVGFYLFTLPVYDALSSWLLYLSIIILVAAIIYALLALTQEGLSISAGVRNAKETSISAVSCALAAFLLVLAWNVLLSRYPYLWDDHQTFSGVTYTEANYFLPSLLWVAIALVVAAVICLVNAFAIRRVRLFIDVVRYVISGEKRQMMLATREIDEAKLPEQSRNWVNEKLIYTHGYGLTMNTANGFDSEGMPKFVLSNMPIESTAPEIKVTRPEIYYGQKTNSNVYVKTRRMEFNYPQGEANNLTSYEGTGGIRIGGLLRRWLLAWALDDLTKLPFSDDVTSESRGLIHRNIRDIVDSVAPFLIYDNDPYIVISSDGRLFWIIDAFTESTTYPYSRHHNADDKTINYIRNSVKVTIDAYNGAVNFYVFDPQDPLIQTYRATFPALFRDAREMPADLRAHVRYPETLIKVQGEVFGLYHTQNTNSFFQREDLWTVAQQVSLNPQTKQQEPSPIEPYFVLMQLPGEKPGIEFVEILPFTPAKRNNMIGWMASRCDGDAYGSLLVYNFPKSRLIDGPLQIEARIDQNAQLSGQFTLWNQQGSHVLRGHLLVIPIGRSLLYVEPVYLQAERSPMPELRLVVLATQDRLAYGNNFEEALSSLFGEAAKASTEAKPEQPKPKPGALPQPSPTPEKVGAPNVQQLINRAIQEFEEYQRLTSEGKLGEAGKKLEEHKRTLEELKKAGSKLP